MNIPTHDELVAQYAGFCSRHDLTESRFGRDATGEAQLIASIRAGRSPSLKTLQRVADFMADMDARLVASSMAGHDAQANLPAPPSSPTETAEFIGGAATLASPREVGSTHPFSPTCSQIPAPDARGAGPGSHCSTGAPNMTGEA